MLTASNNTATGLRALFSDTSGSNNTATGVYALYGNTIGWYNSAVGAYALSNNTEGNYNTANGYKALYLNTEGDLNTALVMLRSIATASVTATRPTVFKRSIATPPAAPTRPTVIKRSIATQSADYNTANRYSSARFQHRRGDNNTALGNAAGYNVTTADNVVCVGAGAAGENFSDRAYIPNIGVFAQAPAAGIEFVTVRLSDGKLGHNASSRRYKEDINPMGDASEVIYKLKPVTYRFKEEDVDPNKGHPSHKISIMA